MTGYSIKALDVDGYELRVHDDWTMNKKEAIRDAKDMLADPELRDAGLSTVQVVDVAGDVVWDDFTESVQTKFLDKVIDSLLK